MSSFNSKLNKEILDEVGANSGNDTILRSFINDLILKESYSEGKGQWREYYLDKIDEISKVWDENEN